MSHAISSSNGKGSRSQPRKTSFHSNRNPKEVLAEFYSNLEKEKQGADLVESKDLNKPLEFTEYATEIYDFLKENERINLPVPGYMRNQTDINEKMRSILFDWLVEVHLKFKLLPETLYLTINLIDRYLAKEQIPRNKL